MNDATLLEAHGISRRHPRGGWLLHDIHLRINAGDRLALIGPAGAGKTLLLRALAMLDPLDVGMVSWKGQPVVPAGVPTLRRHAMYIHQRPALFEGTVEDNLRRPFQLRAYQGRSFDEGRVAPLLAELGRERGFLEKQQRDLSGGEVQIVALLRALQLDPVVLLLDEPTSALDSDTVRMAERLIQHWLQEGAARAVVWVSHDQEQTSRVADRRFHVRAGQVKMEE